MLRGGLIKGASPRGTCEEREPRSCRGGGINHEVRQERDWGSLWRTLRDFELGGAGKQGKPLPDAGQWHSAAML